MCTSASQRVEGVRFFLQGGASRTHWRAYVRGHAYATQSSVRTLQAKSRGLPTARPTVMPSPLETKGHFPDRKTHRFRRQPLTGTPVFLTLCGPDSGSIFWTRNDDRKGEASQLGFGCGDLVPGPLAGPRTGTRTTRCFEHAAKTTY